MCCRPERFLMGMEHGVGRDESCFGLKERASDKFMASKCLCPFLSIRTQTF
jgi:hypothetical protein